MVLNDIFENTPDGIYITDGNAVGARANKGFERLSWMSLDEWMGKDHHDLEKEGFLSISASVRALEEHKVITVLQEYSSSKAVVMNTCYPVFDEQNHPVMTVASIRDLTELNQLKENLAQENALRNKIEKELEDLKSKIVDDFRLMVQKAAVILDQGGDATQICAEAKLFATETAKEVVDSCLQFFGNLYHGKCNRVLHM